MTAAEDHRSNSTSIKSLGFLLCSVLGEGFLLCSPFDTDCTKLVQQRPFSLLPLLIDTEQQQCRVWFLIGSQRSAVKEVWQVFSNVGVWFWTGWSYGVTGCLKTVKKNKKAVGVCVQHWQRVWRCLKWIFLNNLSDKEPVAKDYLEVIMWQPLVREDNKQMQNLRGYFLKIMRVPTLNKYHAQQQKGAPPTRSFYTQDICGK